MVLQPSETNVSNAIATAMASIDEDLVPTSLSLPASQTTMHRSNKRARLVCLRCHEKKIKCDLQVSRRNVSRQCTNCELADYDCRLRPSKRGAAKHRHALGDHAVLEAADAMILLPTPTNFDPQLVFPSSGVSTLRNHAATAGSADLPNQQNAGDYQPDHNETFQPPSEPRLPHLGNSTSQIADVSRQDIDTSPESHVTAQYQASASYLGESGFLQIFSQDRGVETSRPDTAKRIEPQEIDLIPPALQESFTEIYFKYCFPFCPVIDKDVLINHESVANSLLLKHAFALLGSQIEPSVMRHAGPGEYYDRAKTLFYGSDEKNPLTCISALILFHWWGSGPPNTISIDTVWWWTGVAIRQAQEIGLHRELRPGQPLRPGETAGLRRRIWWTLFARERLSSLCQGRPCMIDPEDCNINEPTIEDFPEPRDPRAEFFIYWVRLCAIIGRVAKFLLRKKDSTPFPVVLAQELIAWVQSLPPHIQMPISTERTTPFNRDVHQLQLPYLTTITLLYLSRSSQPLPKAYTAAVIAASCVARIFEDYLARGSLRFLPGMAGWHIAIAILALLHGRQVECLTKAADEHIKILRIALKEMAKLWHSSQMFDLGFERLLGSNAFLVCEGKEVHTPEVTPENALGGLADLTAGSGVELMDYFPYATGFTSPLVKILVEGGRGMAMPFSELEWPSDFTLQLQDLFDNYEGNYDDVFNI